MAEAWRESMERAQALSEEWRAEEASPEATETARYTIWFTSGWAACGDMMAAIAPFPIEDVEWSHERGGRHAVTFTAAWPALKDVQAACSARGLASLNCRRHLPERGA